MVKSQWFFGEKIPPELNLTVEQRAALRHAWLRADGSQGAFVSALELVQNNTQPIGRDMAHAEVADLLLFDQGQEQHLMIWMGRYVAYHTGKVAPNDNGLRAYPLAKLMSWKDNRWQPDVYKRQGLMCGCTAKTYHYYPAIYCKCRCLKHC